jgi:tetratricopeptide (TPR) repeat protein
MMPKRYFSRAAIVSAIFVVMPLSARSAPSQTAQHDDQTNSYSMPEYNAYQAANAEKDPQAKIKSMDDFIAKFPTSTLLQYAYELEYTSYGQLKNYAKEIEFADKLVALGEKAVVKRRLDALQARLQAFPGVFDAKVPDATEQLTKDRDAALLGPKLLAQLQKPANVSDDQWNKSIDTAIAFFNAQAGAVDLQLKDYQAAVDAFKVALQKKPYDATSSYQMGFAYLGTTPPQSILGFWAMARAIDLKVASADKVKDYLRSKVLAYEQPGCENQVDAQLNEMFTLAAIATEPPASYTIPSADDLNKIRQSSNILTVIEDLGGDKAKMTWLAICGAEFPDVVGKIIDVQTDADSIDFMAYTGSSSQDMEAATSANMDVKAYTAMPRNPPAGAEITPQPEVTRLQKDGGIQFSGTIVGYDSSPFLLHWDQVKVDPSTIPTKRPPGLASRPPSKKQ